MWNKLIDFLCPFCGFVVWGSCYYPLLGCTRSQGRHSIVSSSITSCHAVDGEVVGLNIRGQHGRRLVLFCHTHRLHKGPFPICASRSGNIWHWCRSCWAGPTLFSAAFRRVGACVEDESTPSCGVVQPFRIPSVICPECHTSVVIVNWTDELLCGRYKWVVWQYETACIPTWWTNECLVEQMSSCHRTVW